MTISFRTIVRGSLAVFGMAALAGQNANAATVTTIFDTGVVANNASGQPTGTLAAGVADPHYMLGISGATISQATSFTPGSASAYGNQTPGVYAPPTGGSGYIGPTASGTGTQGGGFAAQNTYFDFRTTFSLAGFSTNGASLTGKVAGDNNVVAIYLNNVRVDGFLGPTPGNFQAQGFNIASNFATANTLDFIVFNSSDSGFPNSFNLLALDVDSLVLSATPNPVNVPEPGSVAMLVGMGVTGAGFLSRRKRAAK